MAAHEGFRRLNLLSVYIAWSSLAGLAVWLIGLCVVGPLGLWELIFFVVSPLVIALNLRIISWLLEGFFSPDSPERP